MIVFSFGNRMLVRLLSIFTLLLNIPVASVAFPVLYGDTYLVTIQFEGESPQAISPIYNWGVGTVYNGGDFTGTDYEAFWGSGSKSGYVVWRTFSSQLESGFGSLNVPSSHASIRGQLSHPFAAYADFVVSGIGVWLDYPSLTTISDSGIDLGSIEVDNFSGVSNVVATSTTLSFRVPISQSQFPPVTEFNVGFRGLTPVPEPAGALLMLVAGAVLIGRGYINRSGAQHKGPRIR